VARPSDARTLVLHGVRLRGFGEPAAVAAVVGLDADVVAAELEVLGADGLAVHREGRLTGWSLTPEGRAEQQRRLADEVDAAACRPDVDAAYRAFLALNNELLEVCTAWQMKGDVPNDHSDERYDAEVVDRLVALHARLEPILDRLERCLDRYGGYRARFETAIGKLQAGDGDWFAKPLIDSYHTVWFQLHEDLLNTLGLERSTEEV
jgi:hypothetical protein